MSERTSDRFGFEAWFVSDKSQVAHLWDGSSPTVLCGHVIRRSASRADKDVWTCSLCVRRVSGGGASDE